jgi:hypothetical protein
MAVKGSSESKEISKTKSPKNVTPWSHYTMTETEIFDLVSKTPFDKLLKNAVAKSLKIELGYYARA